MKIFMTYLWLKQVIYYMLILSPFLKSAYLLTRSSHIKGHTGTKLLLHRLGAAGTAAHAWKLVCAAGGGWDSGEAEGR
jgi:hypothetical protein